MIPTSLPLFVDPPVVAGSCDTRSVDLPIVFPTSQGLVHLDLSWMGQSHWDRMEPWAIPAETASINRDLEERSIEILDVAARQFGLSMLGAGTHVSVLAPSWLDDELIDAVLDSKPLRNLPPVRTVEPVAVRQVSAKTSHMAPDSLLRDLLEDD